MRESIYCDDLVGLMRIANYVVCSDTSRYLRSATLNIWVVTLSVLIIGGCVGGGYANRRQTPSIDCCIQKAGNETQNAIADTAARLVGARTVRSGNRFISYDCAGITRALFLAQGIDLYGGTPSEQITGVRRIHAYISQHGRIHRGPDVSRGDLVFFDNTWDANDDGIDNDFLTHVGVIETVESDGTIVFISRTASAIERYRMNLRWPSSATADGRMVNNFLRRKRPGDPPERAYLTGQLFASFGSLQK